MIVHLAGGTASVASRSLSMLSPMRVAGAFTVSRERWSYRAEYHQFSRPISPDAATQCQQGSRLGATRRGHVAVNRISFSVSPLLLSLPTDCRQDDEPPGQGGFRRWCGDKQWRCAAVGSGGSPARSDVRGGAASVATGRWTWCAGGVRDCTGLRDLNDHADLRHDPGSCVSGHTPSPSACKSTPSTACPYAFSIQPRRSSIAVASDNMSCSKVSTTS